MLNSPLSAPPHAGYSREMVSLGKEPGKKGKDDD